MNPSEAIDPVSPLFFLVPERSGVLRWSTRLLAALWIGTLAACGGGGGGGGASGPGTPSAPVVTVQPVDATVSVGGSTTFSVGASGSGVLRFQWLRNAVPLLGATASSYTTAPAVLADSGAIFTVTVTNDVGAVTSRAAIWTVSGITASGRSYKLLAEAGPTAISQLPGDGTYGGRQIGTGDLVLVDTPPGSATLVVAAAGTWYPQASITQADWVSTSSTLRNVRERFRLVFRSNQLVRIDLAAGASSTPARVSALQLSDLCQGPDTPFGEVLADWIHPEDSVLIYQTRPQCQNPFVELADRRYVAVKAGMAPTDAPIDLGARRPLSAIRDRSGAITGFITFDGVDLARTDVQFQTTSVIATVPGVDYKISVVGVFGPDDAPYVLFHQTRSVSGTVALQLFAYRLSDSSPAVSVYPTRFVLGSATDATGTYLVAESTDEQDFRLFRLNDDLTLATLATRLPSNFAIPNRIVLTPDYIVVMSDNETLTSVARSGGTREVYTTGGQLIDTVFAMGNTLSLQMRGSTSGTLLDARVRIMQANFSNPLDLPRTNLLAPLLAADQPVVRRDPLAAGYSRIVVAESQDSVFTTLDTATLAAYDASRVRVEIGRLPAISVGDTPNAVPDVSGVAGAQYFSGYQVGQEGLVTGFGGDSFLVRSSGGAVTKLTTYW